MHCPKCNHPIHTKDGKVKGRQCYQCKQCHYRYTVNRPSHAKSEATRKQALERYLEGNGFRTIGRLLKVSHVRVYNWVKAAGVKGLAEPVCPPKSVQVIELDAKTGRGLWNKLEGIHAETYCTDHLRAYSCFLPTDTHVQGKAETYTVESYHSRIRHYLARFRSRTKCYSKSILSFISLLILTLTNCDPHKEIVYRDKIVEKNIIALGNKYSDKSKIIELANSLKDANNLLIEIKDLALDLEGKQYDFKQFVTEVGADKFIASSLFKSIEKDSKNWKTTVIFNDDSKQVFHSIGDSLHHGDLKIDPYNNNPLAANLYVNMPVKGLFSVEVKGKGGNGIAIKKTFDKVMNADTLPILGLYANYHNVVEIGFYSENRKLRFKKEFIAKTQDINPLQKRTAVVEKNLLANKYEGLYISSNYQVGWDVQGEIRWAFAGNLQYKIRPALTAMFLKNSNGDFIINSNEKISHYHHNIFMIVSPAGKVKRKYTVPKYIHHEVIRLPNGNYLVASNSDAPPANRDASRRDGKLEEDLVVEIDSRSGDVVKQWNLNNIVDKRNQLYHIQDSDDPFHNNSLFYHQESNTIVASCRHQSAVFAFGYDDKKLKWISADTVGWPTSMHSYLLKPVDINGDDIDYTKVDFHHYAQHTATILSNSNLLVFDNGNERGKREGKIEPYNQYSRLAEYKLDLSNKTIQLVSVFDADKKIYTSATGNANQLSNGNFLVGFNNSIDFAHIYELTPNKNELLYLKVRKNDRTEGNYRYYKIDIYENLLAK